jgi:hypothetical protein
MNFSSVKNIKPIFLYFWSIVAFVLSNKCHNNGQLVGYYILLVLGLALFIMGFIKAMRSKGNY